MAPLLFVGSEEAALDDATLRRHHIQGVLNVGGRVSPHAARLRRYLYVGGVHDHEHQDIRACFELAIAFLDACHAANQAVLVHCYAGRSRSVTVVAAFLVARRGLGAEAALAQVASCRHIYPNVGFVRQLHAYARECRERAPAQPQEEEVDLR